MPTTLRNFAATLAAVGLLSLGSFTIAQQESEQPPSDPSSIENIEQSADVGEIRPADEAESARPDTPPPASPDANRPDANNSDANNSDANNPDLNNPSGDDSAEDAANRNNDRPESDNANVDDANAANNNDDRNDENNRDNNRDENRDQSDEDKQLSPPEVPEQARDRDANAREDVNADWRKVDRDGITWFYSPSGQWHVRHGDSWQAYHDGMHYRDLNRSSDMYGNMYGERSVVRNDGRRMNDTPQRYSSGYRGAEVYHSDNGQQHAQQVRYDRCGRAYICMNGRAVYVDVTESAYQENQDQSYDQRQPTEADEQYQDVPPPPEMDEANDVSAERSDVPAPPAPPVAS